MATWVGNRNLRMEMCGKISLLVSAQKGAMTSASPEGHQALYKPSFKVPFPGRDQAKPHPAGSTFGSWALPGD